MVEVGGLGVVAGIEVPGVEAGVEGPGVGGPEVGAGIGGWVVSLWCWNSDVIGRSWRFRSCSWN